MAAGVEVLSGAWVAFSIFSVVLLLASFLLVRYYQDKHESEVFPTIASSFGLTWAVLILFVIPVDIFAVSAAKNHETGAHVLDAATIATLGKSINDLYLAIFSLSLVMGFLIIPLAYFYYEEDDEDVTVRQRLVGATKYTAFLVVILIIILVIGLLIKPGKRPDVKNDHWVSTVLDSGNEGQGSIDFALAMLLSLGYTCWITYTAYGLASMPIRLIKGKLSASVEQADMDADLRERRDKIRKIESTYSLTGKKMSRKDKMELERHKRQERLLSSRTEALTQRQRGWERLWDVLTPFGYLFGIVFLLFTILIVVSLVLGLIDKASFSCGSVCGFITVKPTFNPFDKMLVAMSHAFPMDYITLIATIAYTLFATLHGIKRMSVRFLWLKLYKLRAGQSVPQALLFTAEILMWVALTMTVQLTTLAPQYATFGTQTYVLDGKVVDCTLEAPANECHMTQLALFVNRITLKMNFFGIFYYACNWIIVAIFIIGCIWAITRGKASNLDNDDSSDVSSDSD